MNKVGRFEYQKMAKRFGLGWLRLFCVAALIFSAASAQADEAKISEINIEGNRRVQDKTIAAALTLKVGDSLDPVQVAQGRFSAFEKMFDQLIVLAFEAFEYFCQKKSRKSRKIR